MINNDFVLLHIGERSLLEKVDSWIDQKWAGARKLQAKVGLYSRRYDYLIYRLEMAYKGGEMDKDTYEEKLRGVNLDLESLKDTYRKQISQTNMKERVSEASSASGDLDLSVQFPGVEKDAPVMETLISLQRNPSLGLRDLVETLLTATANERVEILREFESQLRDIPNV